MPTIRVAVASACLYLLWAPRLAFAQDHDTAIPHSTNAATDSLERAINRVVLAEFTPQAPQNPSNQPGTPAPKPPPSLGDLGFPTAQTQGDAQAQARLDKRSHMLKIHQRLGLITTLPLAATLITSGLAGGRTTSSSGRDLHAALGSVTAGLYLTTAYFSIFAPRVPGTTTRGPIRLHKALAWIHGPGMILTPILGAMAYEQRNRGERVHGIASAHGAVAAVTAVAYGLAIVSVSFKF
jgi:hypothetical protein